MLTSEASQGQGVHHDPWHRHAEGHRTELPVCGRAAQAAGASGPSLNPAEVAKFQEMARDWWDPQGSSAALHALNPVRTRFTRDALCSCYG